MSEGATMESMQEKLDRMNDQLQKMNLTLSTHTEQIKGALKRIDEQAKLTETVHNLATSIQLLVAKQEVTTEAVTETNRRLQSIINDVDELKQKPAKKWEESVRTVVLGILAGLVAFLLSKFGLK